MSADVANLPVPLQALKVVYLRGDEVKLEVLQCWDCTKCPFTDAYSAALMSWERTAQLQVPQLGRLRGQHDMATQACRDVEC